MKPWKLWIGCCVWFGAVAPFQFEPLAFFVFCVIIQSGMFGAWWLIDRVVRDADGH